jgi:hypothetical protein
MGRMRRIMEDTIDGRLILTGRLAGNLPAGVAVAVEMRPATIAISTLAASELRRRSYL